MENHKKTTTEQPADRSHVHTEQRHQRSMSLHRLDIASCVKLMNDEDHGVAAAVGDARESIARFIEGVHMRFNERGGRLIYLGAGTSGRLGVLDASEMPPTFQLPGDRIIGVIAGGDRSLRKSSEGLEDEFDGARHELEKLSLNESDSVLGIASGGTTPYVLGGLKYAKEERGALTGLLTCTPIDRDAMTADHVLYIATGPELITGSTRMKAGTATKMVLNIISTTLMIQSGRIFENLMVDLRATNDKLRDRAARIIMTLTGLNRRDAFALLDESGGNVKCAIVMQRRNVSRKDAEGILDQCGGRLDRAFMVGM